MVFSLTRAGRAGASLAGFREEWVSSACGTKLSGQPWCGQVRGWGAVDSKCPVPFSSS